jgi:hypothetical protein
VKENNPIIDRRYPGSDAPATRADEETLVVDRRAALSPSQMVEERLIDLLNGTPLLVSHVQRRLRPGPR